MGRARIPSSFFVFVIVEHDGQVLLIRERKHGQLWYAPAGGLEAGETIREAAIRETMEEAGVRIEIDRLLNVEQQWYADDKSQGRVGEGYSSWWRFVLRAHPIPGVDITPKSWADEHSLEARWVRPDRIKTFALRHPEVIDLVSLALDLGAPTTPPPPCCSHPRGHEPIEPKNWSAPAGGDRAMSQELGPPSIGDW